MNIKNKTYKNFLWVKKQIIIHKHYDKDEATRLAHLVFEDFENDKGCGNRPIDYFIDKLLTKEQYEEEHNNEEN